MYSQNRAVSPNPNCAAAFQVPKPLKTGQRSALDPVPNGSTYGQSLVPQGRAHATTAASSAGPPGSRQTWAYGASTTPRRLRVARSATSETVRSTVTGSSSGGWCHPDGCDRQVYSVFDDQVTAVALSTPSFGWRRFQGLLCGYVHDLHRGVTRFRPGTCQPLRGSVGTSSWPQLHSKVSSASRSTGSKNSRIESAPLRR